jgi:hypothetical protein
VFACQHANEDIPVFMTFLDGLIEQGELPVGKPFNLSLAGDKSRFLYLQSAVVQFAWKEIFKELVILLLSGAK